MQDGLLCTQMRRGCIWMLGGGEKCQTEIIHHNAIKRPAALWVGERSATIVLDQWVSLWDRECVNERVNVKKKQLCFIRGIASLNHIIKTKNAPLISSPNSRKYTRFSVPLPISVYPHGAAIPKLFHYIMEINQVEETHTNTCLGLDEADDNKQKRYFFTKYPNCT